MSKEGGEGYRTANWVLNDGKGAYSMTNGRINLASYIVSDIEGGIIRYLRPDLPKAASDCAKSAILCLQNNNLRSKSVLK